jgi:hypothetical protein
VHIGGDSRRRFSRFRETLLTDDGRRALGVTTRRGRPYLTTAARDFLAMRISQTAQLLVAADIVFTKPPRPGWPGPTDPIPDAMHAALQPSSPEVRSLVQRFAGFLQDGLVRET